jgi:DNA polymerase/3'-5' exonuclease PolX
MELRKALYIAGQVVDALAPHCDIINVAGSCRREKPEVKDIEIVALPKVVTGKDLFGSDVANARSPQFKATAFGLGTVNKGRFDGRYMQIEMKTSAGPINLDLFMPEAEDYYRQFAIRTGSAEWTARVIAGGWKLKGWCGTDQGLRLQSECHGERGPDHKMHWKCITAKSEQTLPPVWKSEEEFFKWLGIAWTLPKYRELK